MSQVSDKPTIEIEKVNKPVRVLKYANHEEYLIARRIKTNEWKARNKEKVKTYGKGYYEENKEKIIKQVCDLQKKKRQAKKLAKLEE